jgi:hypothetical protein
MSLPHLATHLAAAADGPKHPGIVPPLNGAIVFIVLMVLLYATTRLNRDK